jgi:nicotinate-nucleotide adenylyltransferase
MGSRSRIAILGGTFDPIHRGHVEPLVAIADFMGWDRIILIPAATQPFKTGRTSTPALHRWAMAALATSGDPRIILSDIELERGEISYTVDTLEALRRIYPHASLEWVIGDDNLELLAKWKRVDRILELANFVVLRRENDPVPDELMSLVASPADRPDAGKLIPVESPQVPISATEIRERLRRGDPIGGMVASAVEEYISKYGLYRAEEQAWRIPSSGV